jgi:hypothetical protein
MLFLRTDSDIAAYRGLSNGAQKVEIRMAEVVSGNHFTSCGLLRFRSASTKIYKRAICRLL